MTELKSRITGLRWENEDLKQIIENILCEFEKKVENSDLTWKENIKKKVPSISIEGIGEIDFKIKFSHAGRGHDVYSGALYTTLYSHEVFMDSHGVVGIFRDFDGGLESDVIYDFQQEIFFPVRGSGRKVRIQFRIQQG